MAKLSTGCIVSAVIGAFFAFAAVVLVVFLGVGYLSLHRSAPATSTPPLAGAPAPVTASGKGAETPSLTPAQQQAIAGGKTVTWPEQGFSWTVPSDWEEQPKVADSFQAKSPGSFDAGWLLASVSPPLPPTFPADTSLDAMYEQAQDQKRIGKYDSVRWLELDGVRGVEFVEAAPPKPDDVRRVEWQGYVTRSGGPTLITLMTHSSGKGFAAHEDALRAVLYSTKLSK